MSEHERRLDLGAGYFIRYTTPLRFRSADVSEYDVTVELGEDDGRLVCTSMQVRQMLDGPPVTAEGLARLPVVGLFKRAAQVDDLERGVPRIYLGRRLVPLEELPEPHQVMLVYRSALALGMPPTKAVATFLGVSSAVAAKRVQSARRDGLLEPTAPGKKGR